MRKLVLAAALLAALSVAPAANAKIVVGKSIAGVALDVSANDVIATLGQPQKTTATNDPDTGQPLGQEFDYGNTIVLLAGNKVSAVLTRSKKEKTATGVGVGTSEKQLKRKVKGLHCSGKGGNRSCVKGSGKTGTVFTGFLLSAKKKVKAITVGRLQD